MWNKLQRGRPAIMGALTILVVMASIASRSRVEHLTAQLGKETAHSKELQSRVEILESRVQQYTSVREVAPRAERDLGLSRAEPERVHVLHFASPQGGPAWVSEAYAGKAPGSNR